MIETREPLHDSSAYRVVLCQRYDDDLAGEFWSVGLHRATDYLFAWVKVAPKHVELPKNWTIVYRSKT